MTRGLLGLAARTTGVVRGAAVSALLASLASTLVCTRGLFALAARAALIAWQAAGTVLFPSAAAAFLCVLGYRGEYFGMPLLGAAFFLGIGAAATVGKPPYENTFLVLRIGAPVLLCALPCIGAVLVGARLADAHGEDHYLAGWALFLGVTFLGTFVLCPILEAAARLARGPGTMRDALAAALVATGRRGLVHSLVVGLGATAAVALVPLLDTLGPVRLIGAAADPDSYREVIAIAASGGAVSWAFLLLLSGALATEPCDTREKSRSAFTFVVVGIALLLAATVCGTTLLPAPLDRSPPEALLVRNEAAIPRDVTMAVERVTTDGPGLLVVRHGSTISTVLPVSNAQRVRLVRDLDGSYAVVVLIPGLDGDYGAIWIDEQGRRLDDGPLDRIRAHLVGPPFVALTLSALLVSLALFRARGRARLHRAVRRGRESIVAGRLHAEVGSMAAVTAGVARTNGWQLHATDGGSIVELPPHVPVLGGTGESALSDGQEIELVAPAPVRTMAFRDGPAPCPKGSVLVRPGSGRLDELVGTWALVPAGGLLAASSIAAIAGTLLALGGAAMVRELLPWASSGNATVGYSYPMPTSSADALDDAHDADRAARVAASAFASSIEVVSPTETRLTTALRDDLGGMRALPGGARVNHVRALSDVRDGSILDLLGFQDDDIIVAVAGIPVGDVGTLRALFTANRNAGALAVRVARDGEEIDLVFRVTDRLP